MKIMQHELLVTSGVLDTAAGRIHDPLPVVPLKVLVHNELIGRVMKGRQQSEAYHGRVGHEDHHFKTEGA